MISPSMFTSTIRGLPGVWLSANKVVPVQALSGTYVVTAISGSGVPLGIGTVVVGGVVVLVGATVVVGGAVVGDATVVVGGAVVGGAVVVAVGAVDVVVVDAAVSELPPHAEASRTRATVELNTLTV